MDIISQLVINNAIWIHEASAALDLGGKFTPILWQNLHDMPPIFPNADILGGTDEEQLAAISALVAKRDGRVTAVKDAWAKLDLSPLGFEPLFEAQWLYRDANSIEIPATDLQIERITTAKALREFSIACNSEELADVYSPALLNRPDIAWIVARRDGEIVGGVTAVSAHDLNGINNLFATNKADEAHLLRAAIQVFPDLATCGYETDDKQAAYFALNFQTVGTLRVWLKYP